MINPTETIVNETLEEEILRGLLDDLLDIEEITCEQHDLVLTALTKQGLDIANFLLSSILVV